MAEAQQSGVIGRLRALVEAGIAVTSELSLDATLQRIVEAAAEITGAPYAALGVIDRSGQRLERFVTTGISMEEHARIGELPRGRGILGVLIQDARPLRLEDLTSDPRSVGVPPNHPEMHAFLGVPILLRGIAYGNLYLTEKEGGFTVEDEELVTLLAAQAAVAVENARLYESATRWSRQLESLNEIGIALIGELELDRLLELVASSLRDLIRARMVLIVLPSGDDRLRVEAAVGDGGDTLLGWAFPRSSSKAGRVLARGRSERVDEMLEDPEVDHDSARRFAARTGLFVPLVVRERPIGVIVAHDKVGADNRFGDDDVRVSEQFAARAATAVDLSERVARDALRRVVGGQELERRRIARELHDETGQALTSILLGLKSVEEAKDEESLRAAAANLRRLVVATLQDVRRLAVELRPKALDDFGLVPALERLIETFCEHTGIDVQLEARIGNDRLPEEVETTLYRLIQEALTNVVKHAQAHTVSILLTRRESAVSALIEDDGRGFDPTRVRDDALGLVGMRERVGLLGGRLTVEAPSGAGTTLAVEVPVR
jgi:two-component system, NarL family, sensor histidine kinase DevS